MRSAHGDDGCEQTGWAREWAGGMGQTRDCAVLSWGWDRERAWQRERKGGSRDATSE